MGRDISSVETQEKGTESENREKTDDEEHPHEGKVCPECGSRVEAVFPLCSTCGHEFSEEGNEIHGPGRAVGKGRLIEEREPLQLVIGEDVFPLANGDILGREGTVAGDYFNTFPTVSRQHLFVAFDGRNWSISVPRSVRNPTLLDGKEMTRGQMLVLSGEHRVQLSSQCSVTLRVSHHGSGDGP